MPNEDNTTSTNIGTDAIKSNLVLINFEKLNSNNVMDRSAPE